MYDKNNLSSLRGQKLKYAVFEILHQDNWQEEIKALIHIHGAKLTNAFFSASYSESSLISHRAIASFGFLTKYLSTQSREKIRILVRRCIWMLTEESGGIPWKAPEIMGHIMSTDRWIAEEYCDLLFSYLYENDSGVDNFLEHTLLRKSVYLGIIKLSEKFPGLVFDRKDIIEQRLKMEKDSEIKVLLTIIVKNSKLNGFEEYFNA